MQSVLRTDFSLTLVVSLCWIVPGYSQTSVPPSTALKPYTAPDKSVSAGVPDGWQVTNGGQTVVSMSGPEGATVVLGNTVIARNAAFQPGQRPAKGIDLNMPYAAALAQKFGMILEQGAAVSGKPFSQFAIASSTPLQLAPTLGQCARFVAGFTGDQGPMKIMAVFCSLPLDATGTYKNMMLAGQAPASVATQIATTVQSIFKSYRVPTDWLEKKLAPFGAPAPVAVATGAVAAAAINRSTIVGAAGADTSANCFDLSVLRQTPTYELPRSCGGTKPD